MKSTILFICFFLLLVLQSTAFNFSGALMLWPDIALLLAIFGGLRWNRIGGVQFGMAVGFVQDLLSYQTMGAGLFSKGIIGFTVGILRENYIHDTPVSRVALVIGSTVFDAIVYGTIIQLFFGINLFPNIGDSIVGLTLINLAFSFIILPMIAWIERRVDRLSGSKESQMLNLPKER